MKYRIMLSLAFDDEDDAMDVWDKVKDAWEKGSHLEDDNANIHRCYHDEEPTKPCEIIEEL